MEIMQFANADSFNAIFTIYVNVTIITAPLFAGFALMSK